MNMRIVTVVRQYLAAAFFIAIGLIASGCGDTASVNPVVELASLTVDPGTLQPAFSGGATQYNVDLSNNITSVRVTAQPAVAGDTVSINGQATTSSVITLGAVGTTTPVSIVVSESGTNSRTYTVLLVRAGLTGNNSLQNLTVSPGTLAPPFDPNFQSYTVDVANNVGSVTVTPTLSDPAATMTVNGQPTNSGQAQTITLGPAGQPTNIPIVVTAQNGSAKTYQVTVSRGVSSNNNLQGLTVTSGTLNPSFNATRTSYTVNVASTVNSVTVTPRLQDTTATMNVNGQGTNSGQARAITLNGAGSNTLINIVVTAQNNTQKIYIVNVSRAALGGNNNLSGLSVSPGSLDPNFSANTTNYTVDVGSGVSSVTVTPTRQDSNATITVNGTPATSGQGRSITLNGAGSNTSINVTVTAPNGSQKSYTITVERAALGGNNNLQSLTVSPGTLSPAFSTTRTRTDYAVNDIGSSATSILVTADPQDSSATVTINTQGGNSRSIPLPGGPSNTDIDIRVIAPNGNDKTYSITVTQPAPATPPTPASAPDLIPADDSCPLLQPPDPLNPDPDGCFPGTSRSDNITSVTTPRFRISPPGAGETPSLNVDGSKVDATFDQGANTLRPTAPLSDGDRTITYTLTNAGGESQPSPSLTVNIDTVAPVQ
ncbi:MAG: cadherin-like beta sandwich domain-containing protein [Nitrospira sp.]|nr:cadherin-like beta sandwich domain-containing protein [Nitrospira sp.]